MQRVWCHIKESAGALDPLGRVVGCIVDGRGWVATEPLGIRGTTNLSVISSLRASIKGWTQIFPYKTSHRYPRFFSSKIV